MGVEGPSGSVSVLFGDALGNFGPHVDFAIGTDPSSVWAGDLNGDGFVDLVADGAGAGVVVLLGDGTGAFGAKTVAMGGVSSSVAVGDLNGDNRLDLVSASEGSDNVSVALGDGLGNFGRHVDFATGNGPRSVAIGDVSVDDRPDLITANSDANTVSVLTGDGSGGFAPKIDFATGTLPQSVAVGDLNFDNRPDLVVANQLSNTVSVLLNSTGTSLTTPVTFGPRTDFPGGGSDRLAVGDLNRDGFLDAVALGGSGVSVLLGDGTGRFGTATEFDAGPHYSASLALGDFNGDGNLDVAVGNEDPGSISVLLGDGAGGFGAPTDFAIPAFSAASLAVGDVNGDAALDLVVGTPRDSVSVLLGNGDGTFRTHTEVPAGVDPEAVAVADVNGDGTLDLMATGPDQIGVSVLLGHGDGTFGAQTDYANRSGPYAVAVGDLNRDGTLDLVTADYGDDVSVLLGIGDGTFRSHADFQAGDGPWSLAVADFNGDGFLDVATGNARFEHDVGAAREGDRNARRQNRPRRRRKSFSIAAADLNGDGRPDLVAANSTVSVLLNTTPQRSSPGAPTIGAAVGGNRSATISWTPPASDGGATITAYVVTPYIGYFPLRPSIFASPATTETITALANGTQYRFRVQAVNAVGTSPYSKVTSIVVPTTTVPDAPMIGVAAAGDGNGDGVVDRARIRRWLADHRLRRHRIYRVRRR